jgi:phospholipase/lecithinase/hemolysin
MNIKNTGVLSLIFALVLALPAAASAHQAYSKLVVFGDSLSDPGNAFVLTGQVSIRPFNLIPDAPYAIGGLHFSNGKTWAEDLAKDLHLPSGPAFRNPLYFTNYAVGGARARSVTGVDLTDQVNLFLGKHNNTADPDALYVILIGGNDIRDAIVAYQADASGATSADILKAALTAVADNIQTLAAAGAHKFLIGNAPNLALVPAILQQGTLAQFLAQLLSVEYNTELDITVKTLGTAFSLEVARLDLFGLLQSLVVKPRQLGLTDVTDSCITPGVIAHAICKDPGDYLFWDGIHPTRGVHAFLASQALQQLH